jgi:CRISPR-associated exonuclease Cas4
VEFSADATLEDALIPISALQHYLFCPRQCALIHVEQSWAEDGATAEGRLLHERIDAGKPDRRQGVKILRSLTIRSFTLGVTGKADVVELHGAQPYPVEYKRGSPKTHHADAVQLCAQAICLEEMFGVPIPEGALFYGQTRRRSVVAFDPALRALTEQVAADARQMIAAQITPPPVYTPACEKCSMQEICRPERLEKPPRIANWLASQIKD